MSIINKDTGILSTLNKAIKKSGYLSLESIASCHSNPKTKPKTDDGFTPKQNLEITKTKNIEIATKIQKERDERQTKKVLIKGKTGKFDKGRFFK